MALDQAPYVLSKASLVVNDYTGTPLTYTVSQLQAMTLIPKLTRARQRQTILTNSSSGQALYTTVDQGIVGDDTIEIGLIFTDNAVQSGYKTATDLFRGMVDGDLSGTGFSTWVTTHPSGKGGVKTVKWLITIINEAGVSTAWTIPASVQAADLGDVNGNLGLTATLHIEGAITVA